MAQRHEHLALPQPPLVHVVLHDRQPAGVAVLVPKPLEDPLRGVPLLRRTALILLQDLVDDPDERVQLRSRRRLRSADTRAAPRTPSSWLPSAGRSRTAAPPRDGSTPQSEPHSEPSIELHALHPPPPADAGKGLPLPDFYSGATDQSAASVRDFLSGAYTPRMFRETDGRCGRDKPRFTYETPRSGAYRSNINN